MKQALIKKGKAVLRDVPAPTVTQPQDVVVKTAYSLISRGTELTSLNFSKESLVAKAKRRPDAVIAMLKEVQKKGVKSAYNKVIDQLDHILGQKIGYSLSGTVVAVGSAVTEIKVGDRVACAGANIANHAEFVNVPKNLVVKLPKQVSFQEGATATVGAIAMQSVRRAQPQIGEWVCVIGLGLLGQLIIQIIKANGCHAIGIDPDASRRKLATSLGADHVFSPSNVGQHVTRITNNHGADSTIIAAATSSNEPLQQAMEVTRRKGRVVILGIVGKSLQQNPFFRKEIDLLMSASYGPGRYDPRYEDKALDYPYAYVRWTEQRNMSSYLDLIAQKKLTIKPLTTKTYEFNDVNKAFESLTKQPQPIMVFLKYNPAANAAQTSITISNKPISKKIRAAIIGAGWISKEAHLPNIKSDPNIAVHLVVDRDPVNAHKTALFYGARKSSTNYKEALTDKNVHTVVIASQHNTHADMILAAAKAKKAIFVEKPLVLDKKDLPKVVAAIKKYKVPIMVGFNRRFSPYAEKIHELLEARTSPAVILYRVNAGFLTDDHWLQDPDIGGGRIIGELCHMIDFSNYITGTKVQNVHVAAAQPSPGHPLSDNVTVTLEYEDGSLSTIIYSSLGSQQLAKEYVEVHADETSYVIDDYQKMNVYGKSKKTYNFGFDKGLGKEMHAWAKFLKGKQTIPIPIDESIAATEITFTVMDKLLK